MQLVVWAGQRFPEEDLGSFQVLPQGWVGLVEGKWDPRQEATDNPDWGRALKAFWGVSSVHEHSLSLSEIASWCRHFVSC